MIPIVPRDLSLDLTLESEARTTLILVGIALAIVFLFTALFFYRHTLLAVFRRVFRFFRPIENMTFTEAKSNTPSLKTTTNMPSTSFFPGHARSHRPSEPRRTSGSSFFGGPMRSASNPRRPAAVYFGANGLHHGLPKAHPPALRPGYLPPSRPLRYYPHTQTPVGPQVSPQVAALMHAANSVVGRHPNARPLSDRIATQAEIDLISGHVHIPWAFTAKRRSQPVPVKVQAPVVVDPAPRPGYHQHIPAGPPAAASNATVEPTRPGLLKDIKNMRRPDVSGSFEGIPGRKRHRVRGKENVPITPAGPASRRNRL